MSRKALPVNIYRYYDYRRFLHDLFIHFAKNTYRFTHRKFSFTAGFSTPNFLKDVIDGKRNLGPVSIERICTKLEFNKGETEFFSNLVQMNQAASHEEKDRYYQRLGRCPAYQTLHKGDRELYEFYSNWYYAVIRELVATVDFRADPAWIADRVSPAITREQAQRALQVLSDTGQIRQNTDGTWEQTTPVLTTGPEIESLAVSKYHHAMITLASTVIASVPHTKRNISSLTLAISPDTYELLVREIYSVQKRIIELATREQDGTEVYQMNFQLFPVTAREHRRSR